MSSVSAGHLSVSSGQRSSFRKRGFHTARPKNSLSKMSCQIVAGAPRRASSARTSARIGEGGVSASSGSQETSFNRSSKSRRSSPRD